MSGPTFPVPVPRIRDDDDGPGPTVEGDQKYDPKDGSLVESHRGVAHLKDNNGQGGVPLKGLYVWMEE